LVRHTPRLLVLILCVVIALPAGAAPAEPWLIVPGQSLGMLRLGVPAREVRQMPGWNQPSRTHVVGTITYMSYDRQGVTVVVRDEVVVMLLTTNERYRTDRGTAVGQPTSAATGPYGAPPAGEERVLWYDALGLLVVTGGGTIVRLGIYDPKAIVRVILAEERPARDVFLTVRAPQSSRASDATASPQARLVVVTITLRNTSRTSKSLNPNFFTLMDRSGKAYRYDPSTFRHSDACRSTVTVKPGETGSCTLAFALPGAQAARSIVFNDGASTDEAYF
jgi:hypothetical protein